MKIDLRLSEQNFKGKLDEVFTLKRQTSMNNFGVDVVYYQLVSNKKGLDSIFTAEACQSTMELKQEIIKRLEIVTNQYFRF